MITARALGLLTHMVSNGLVGGVKALSGVFTEGRDALYKAMNELIKAGLVKRDIQTIGSRHCTVIEVTEEGYNFLETRMANFLESRYLIQQSPLNSILTSNSIFINNIKKSTEQVGEEYKNTLKIGVEGMSFLGELDKDWDDINEQRQRDKERKQRKWEEQQKAKAKGRFHRREDKPISQWTASDITYEFASRLEQIWSIPPWRVGETRFAFAMSSFRKRYNTTPQMELKAMDLFFKKHLHEKSMDNPDKLWRMFIAQAPSLLEDVKRLDYEHVDVASVKDKAKKKLGELFDV